ncbi:LuxR C-terminal-related transcriptional regulator [Arthrobacter sp. fls2-241-R2A-200]|uniref:LuxR C-terminal-related transcriptional regulator n=1 Tax=Arthrobacter sp. fls2-241-R2A-200 TaxID=3040281 RepID=UPI00254EA540|nr:LuxR C-terminal-related transcriptional regulator [Arthrobacter sp. fls2-241-R2A-200]
MDQLTTIAAELKRIDGRARPRPQQATRPTQRYRLTDRFTPDELNHLVARYQAGESSLQLAKEKGMTKSTFLRLLANHGVEPRKFGLTPAKEREVLHLRQQGMGMRRIAAKVGCSYGTVRTFLINRAA